MRRIGIIGGMSWESTQLYYRLINERVRSVKGGLSSAPLLIHSVDFAPVAAMQSASDWAGLTAMMVSAGRDLRAAGAQALAIATNTMHKMAGEVIAATDLPLIHIADATATAIRADGLSRVALLTPFFPAGDEAAKAALEAAGLIVPRVLGLRAPGPAAIGRIGLDRLREAVRELDGPDVEAIVQLGTNLPFATVAREAEAALGKPVLATNPVTYWHALRRAGIADRIAGAGRLFVVA